jgi:hypothetical protein
VCGDETSLRATLWIDATVRVLDAANLVTTVKTGHAHECQLRPALPRRSDVPVVASLEISLLAQDRSSPDRQLQGQAERNRGRRSFRARV